MKLISSFILLSIFNLSSFAQASIDIVEENALGNGTPFLLGYLPEPKIAADDSELSLFVEDTDKIADDYCKKYFELFLNKKGKLDPNFKYILSEDSSPGTYTVPVVETYTGEILRFKNYSSQSDSEDESKETISVKRKQSSQEFQVFEVLVCEEDKQAVVDQGAAAASSKTDRALSKELGIIVEDNFFEDNVVSLIKDALAKGANPTLAFNKRGDTPFCLALTHGKLNLVRAFFEFGGQYKYSPFCGNETLFSFILKTFTKDESPRMVEDTRAIFKYLIDQGFSINRRTRGSPSFHPWSVAKTPTVKRMLESLGVELSSQDKINSLVNDLKYIEKTKNDALFDELVKQFGAQEVFFKMVQANLQREYFDRLISTHREAIEAKDSDGRNLLARAIFAVWENVFNDKERFFQVFEFLTQYGVELEWTEAGKKVTAFEYIDTYCSELIGKFGLNFTQANNPLVRKLALRYLWVTGLLLRKAETKGLNSAVGKHFPQVLLDILAQQLSANESEAYFNDTKEFLKQYSKSHSHDL